MKYDDGTIERDVAHARISVHDEEITIQKAVSAMELSTKLLVTQLAHAMDMAMFMAGDYVIRHSVTLCNTMYLVDAGKIMTFGREITVPFGLSVIEEGDALGDKEIATLVAGHPARSSWYNARSTRMTYCYVLEGARFVALINKTGFSNFLKYIKRYGTWYNFKLNIMNAIRSGDLAAMAAMDRVPEMTVVEQISRDATHVEGLVRSLERNLTAQIQTLHRTIDDRFRRVEARLDANDRARDASAPGGGASRPAPTPKTVPELADLVNERFNVLDMKINSPTATPSSKPKFPPL